MDSKMKMTKKIAICFFVLLLFVLPCYSQKEDILGWQDARWGMTEKQLQETFKSELTKLPKREIFAQAYTDYAIPDYEIEGRKYTVYFQMDKETNKLSQVLVRYNEMKSRFSQDIYFNGLESLLTRKYGTAGYKKDDKKSGHISLERQWVFPTTTIDLSYSWMDLIDFSLLTIRYFPTKSGDLKKV
jgi:hypothetical protein